MNRTVLVVDDEADLVTTLEYALRKEGYWTRQAGHGEGALREAEREPVPDLILLDLMLPDMSGLEVCRRLRQSPLTRQVPVIMLTAKGEEIDRVVGFEVGADDYVVKPFSVRELLLRVQAVLRRQGGAVAATGQELRYGLLRVDLEGCRVWVGDGEVVLTATEFNILRILMERRGRVQTRDHLLDAVWGTRAYVQVRTVDAHVKRLREKLGPADGYIETMRGMGYRFKPGDEA